MPYSKDQLKKWSGGDKVRITYKVPTIKFNGNTGLLSKFSAGDFKNGVEITDDVEIVIMRPRRVFTSYEKASDGTAIRLFTNEHNTWQDRITVFEAKENQRVKAVGSGTIEDLRSEFPTLRINSNLYCLYKDEVHKLVVRGRSRQSLIDKQKELAKDNFEFFEKKIKLVPTQEAGNAGNVYYFLNYEITGDSDLDKIGPHMEDISKIMDKIDAEYVERSQQATKDTDALTGENTEEDIIPIEKAVDDGDNNVIRPEEIPF